MYGGDLVVAKTGIVLRLEIRVGHGGQVLGAQWICREQSCQESTRPIELGGFRGDARRFEGELGGQIRPRVLRCVEQDFDGLRGLVVAHVKIDHTAQHSENQRMIAIQGIGHAGRAGDVFFRFKKACMSERQAHLVDGIVGNGGKALAGALLDGVESQTAGVFLKLSQRSGRRLDIDAGLQQRLEIFPALLRFEHRDAQRHGLRRGIGGDGGCGCPVYQAARLRPVQ